MNLGELRKLFIERSGRFDLVEDAIDFVDNGANQYINSAQKFLDKQLDVTHSQARLFRELSANDIGVTFTDCRVVQEVWCADTESRTWVEKVDYPFLRGKPDLNSLVTVGGVTSPFNSLDTGRPLDYTPARLRVTPDISSLPMSELDLIMSYGDVMLSSSNSYNGIIFIPPADTTYMVEIVGLFYSPTLASDSDETEWTVVHPNILLMAAMREVEVFYRNTEGVKDWDRTINAELTNIDFDNVQQQLVGVDQMEG